MDKNPQKSLKLAPIALALSVSLTSNALAGPGDVNSTNNGGVITGGTYYNTVDGRTTFVNNGGSGGLVLPSGQVVRGLEVNGGTPTGNGGALHFYAPGGMVRLDGSVDVSALIKNGSYIGNGGRVFVDAGMLYQNGTVFANGLNGGLVQFNVGSAMFGPASRVEAQGFGGLAGTIGVNATGVVDISQGALFDASGRSINTQNLSDNVNVNIVGSLVNNAGIIRANAVNIEDGHVTFLPEGDAAEVAKMVTSPEVYTPGGGSGLNGGVIRVVATGQTRTDCVDCLTDKSVKEGILSTDEADAIKSRQAELVAQHEGDVVNTGTIQANGGDAQTTTYGDDGPIAFAVSEKVSEKHLFSSEKDGGNGGTIIASAADDIINDGLIQANGGNGADSGYFGEYLAKSENFGASLPGKGGNGGTISLSAVDEVVNGLSTSGYCVKPSSATIEANGGNGGNNNNFEYAYAEDYDLKGETAVVLGHPSPFAAKPAAQNALNRAIKDANVENAKTSASAVTDNSNESGGDGGNGGVIGISYGSKMINNGTISAQGGDGGYGPGAGAQATATTNESSTFTAYYKEQPNNPGRGGNNNFVIKSLKASYDRDAYAYASAKAGSGGDGGNGGLVVFSGPGNPTGTGVVNVNGGDGGNGGTASATASAFSEGYAEAKAYAFGGNGGKGGKAGYVVTPNPASASFNYTAKDGNSGIAGMGQAFAQADGGGKKDYAVAYAKGNDLSTADADAFLKYDDVDIVYPTFDWSNNSLLTTRNNELLINGNTAILMTKGGGYSYLTDRLDDATVRSVKSPLGWAKSEGPIRHFVVASTTQKQSLLMLDKPWKGFNGLTSLTLTSNKNVTVPDGTTWTVGAVPRGWWGVDLSSGGGHLSIVAPNGTVINGGNLWAFGAYTGGSIAIAAKEIKNGLDNGSCGKSSPGSIITTGFFHGGSIILKGHDVVENLAVTTRRDGWQPSIISTSGLGVPPMMGGTIRLQSFGTIFNEGYILANGWDQGGSIIAKAGNYALNNGFVEAKGSLPFVFSKVSEDSWDDEWDYDPTGTGGFIRWHGNALSANLSGGTLDVSGGKQGGIIQLTSGGPTTAVSLPISFNGIGITQGTLLPSNNPSLVNALAMLPLGSALNAGVMDARGGLTNGQIDIAGDGFAGLEATSIVNGEGVGANAAAFFAKSNIGSNVRLIAGEGAVKAVACGGDLPKTPDIPDNPDTPADPESPEIPPVVTVPDVFSFDVLGLPFQNQRPYLNDRLPAPTNNKLVLRLGSNNLYLSKAYASVTQEILTLALKEYNRELADGHPPAEALRITQLYLSQAGIDAEIASQLVEAINAGDYQADQPVVAALKAIINSETAAKSASTAQ